MRVEKSYLRLLILYRKEQRIGKMFEYDAKKLEKFCIYQLMSFKISQVVSFKQFVEKSCFFMKYIVKRKEKKSVCQYKNVKSDQRIN